MASDLDRKRCWQWSDDEIKWLERVISKDQLEVIRLAFIGLGIYIKDKGWDYSDRLDGHPPGRYSYPKPDVIYIEDDAIPLSFSTLCMKLVSWKPYLYEDAPYLLYVVLLGVGVDILLLVEVGFDCGTEIDTEFLHQNYPKFTVLLAVGSMVISMSDSEYKKFCNDMGCNSEYYDRRCNAVAHSRLCNIIMDHPQKWASLSEILNQYELSYDISDYFDSLLGQKLRLKASAQRALKKGMEEGYVSLNNIKMVICGPPFVGKTAFKHLLLNKPPPLKHNSTPIAARPIQAIERIAAGDNTWEEPRKPVKRIYYTCYQMPLRRKILNHCKISTCTNAATIPDHIRLNDEKDHSVLSSPHAYVPVTNAASLVLPAQKESLPSEYKSYAIHEPSVYMVPKL